MLKTMDVSIHVMLQGRHITSWHNRNFCHCTINNKMLSQRQVKVPKCCQIRGWLQSTLHRKERTKSINTTWTGQLMV